MDFTELINLASERVGGGVLAANDEFFAPKENLLKASKPIFIEGQYTEVGKWMDGWETRRRRTPGFDWCIIRLGLPGIIRGVVVDTSHFKGNYPEHCSLEACAVEGNPDTEMLTSTLTTWKEILAQASLQGDGENGFPIRTDERFTHVRFKIYPDGGVARLRVYGEVVPDWVRLAEKEVDLAAVENGGLVVACSDMFFGSRHNLIMPGRAANMSDGWETRRRRGPGHDWVIIRLGAAGTARRVEVDTSHFKGNFPESCSLEGCPAAENASRTAPGGESGAEFLVSASWSALLPRTKLRADTRHFFEKELRSIGEVTYLRFNIYPDGGVARLRVTGVVSGRKS